MNIFKRLGLKLRLTLLFVFIFTGSLAVFSYFLFEERMQNRIAEFDANLYNYAIDIAESLDIDSYGEVEFDPGIIKLNEKIFPFSQGKSLISVLDVNGKVVAHSQAPGEMEIVVLDEATLLKVLKKGVSFANVKDLRGKNYRVINYLLPVLKIDSPLILQISAPTTSIELSKHKLKRFLIISLGIILFISCFMGFAFMGRALRPIIEITNKTKQIDFKNLKERVPVPFARDEIHNLAETINHLLERLSLSFEKEERFVQDASHQLKTPLAIMKGELDLFKAGKKSETELTPFLESLSDELNSLIKLTNDLLILARVDSADNNLSLHFAQLDEILLTQVSRLSKLAHSKRIIMNINFNHFEIAKAADLQVLVDPDLIGILFYNFIENAIKYSPDGSKVEIIGNLEKECIIISIVDSGEGIKKGFEEKIFERFYRSENVSTYQGSGLGLAICKAVAKLHHAEIWATKNEKIGSTFYFKIKNAKQYTLEHK